jgi:hypothetical protein
LVHLAAPFYSAEIDVTRVGRPLTVPETNIYTPDDGIVAWQSCFADNAGTRAAIQVSGAHTTLCRNPQVLTAVVERLGRFHPSEETRAS